MTMISSRILSICVHVNAEQCERGLSYLEIGFILKSSY